MTTEFTKQEISILIDLLRDQAYREAMQINITKQYTNKIYQKNQIDKIDKLENLKEKLEEYDSSM